MEKLQSKAMRHMYRAIEHLNDAKRASETAGMASEDAGVKIEDGALEKLFTECPGLNEIEINSLQKWSYMLNMHIGQFLAAQQGHQMYQNDLSGKNAAKNFLIAMNVDNETDLEKYTRLRWLTRVLLTRIHLFVHESNIDLANAVKNAIRFWLKRISQKISIIAALR